MTNHKVRFFGGENTWQARCACKKRSPTGSRGDAEAWIYTHLQEIERVRAHLGSRTPSLRSQRDWFLKQAEDAANPSDDRQLWQQLADELEHYVNARQPMTDQDQLF